MDEVLLEELKLYCGITWEDPVTDRQVRTLMENGMAFLDLKRGAPADYHVPGLPRSLLMDYVRYGRAEALDVFAENYLSLITAMQNERRVKDCESAQPPQP